MQISAYKSCAAFIRAARKAGFGGTFYNVSFVGTQALAKELGADTRSVVVAQVMPYPFAPNYSSMEGFVAEKTLAEGMCRAGSGLTLDNLIGGLESLRDFNVGGFFVDFSAQKHTGSKYVDMTILTADGNMRR